MSKQSARRHRDGRYLDDYVIEDGGEVRVPVQLCDSMAGHRRGYAELSWREIADRRAAFESRQQMIDAARSAWQDGKRRREPEPDEDDEDDDDTRDAARTASYQAMCLRLQDAYKRPASEFRTISSDFRTPRGLNHFGSFSNRSGSRDAAEPDMSSPPDKDKLYEARKSELSNMWRMTGPAPGPQATHIGPGVSGHVNEIGRRDPAAAGRNERELEQMRSPQ